MGCRQLGAPLGKYCGEGDGEDKEQEENRFFMPGGVRLGGEDAQMCQPAVGAQAGALEGQAAERD